MEFKMPKVSSDIIISMSSVLVTFPVVHCVVRTMATKPKDAEMDPGKPPQFLCQLHVGTLYLVVCSTPKAKRS